MLSVFLSALCPPAPLKSLTFWRYSNQIIIIIIIIIKETLEQLYVNLHSTFISHSQPTASVKPQSLSPSSYINNCINTTTVLRPLFWDHPGEPVPEENFWTLWCKERSTEADTPTLRLGVTPSGLTSAHLHHPPIFFTGRTPSCHPTNSVKALKAITSTSALPVKQETQKLCLFT